MARSDTPRRRGRLLGALVIVAAIAVLVVVLASGDGEDEDAQVRETLAAYIAATQAKDYQRLCDQLYASELVTTVEGAGLPCEVALRTGLEDVRRPTLVVRSVEVADEQALARVRTGADGQEPASATIRLVQERGRWRVASLAEAQPQPPSTLTP